MTVENQRLFSTVIGLYQCKSNVLKLKLRSSSIVIHRLYSNITGLYCTTTAFIGVFNVFYILSKNKKETERERDF